MLKYRILENTPRRKTSQEVLGEEVLLKMQ